MLATLELVKWLCSVVSTDIRSLCVDENRNLTTADFQPGLYLLGDIPFNGIVKSFCAYGIIQTNGRDINEADVTGRITFFIARRNKVLESYNVEQVNADETACEYLPSKLMVMPSDKVYVRVRRRCNESAAVCPLQVTYKSDAEITYYGEVFSRQDVQRTIRMADMLDPMSINMTSLNVQINFQEGMYD